MRNALTALLIAAAGLVFADPPSTIPAKKITTDSPSSYTNVVLSTNSLAEYLAWVDANWNRAGSGLVGPPGPPGSNGQDGAMGPPGSNGLDGAVGPVGPINPAFTNWLDTSAVPGYAEAAYNWGNHADYGYITGPEVPSYETDPGLAVWLTNVFDKLAFLDLVDTPSAYRAPIDVPIVGNSTSSLVFVDVFSQSYCETNFSIAVSNVAGDLRSEVFVPYAYDALRGGYWSSNLDYKIVEAGGQYVLSKADGGTINIGTPGIYSLVFESVVVTGTYSGGYGNTAEVYTVSGAAADVPSVVWYHKDKLARESSENLKSTSSVARVFSSNEVWYATEVTNLNFLVVTATNGTAYEGPDLGLVLTYCPEESDPATTTYTNANGWWVQYLPGYDEWAAFDPLLAQMPYTNFGYALPKTLYREATPDESNFEVSWIRGGTNTYALYSEPTPTPTLQSVLDAGDTATNHLKAGYLSFTNGYAYGKNGNKIGLGDAGNYFQIWLNSGAKRRFSFNYFSLSFASDGGIAWSVNSDANDAGDLSIVRDSANVAKVKGSLMVTNNLYVTNAIQIGATTAYLYNRGGSQIVVNQNGSDILCFNGGLQIAKVRGIGWSDFGQPADLGIGRLGVWTGQLTGAWCVTSNFTVGAAASGPANAKLEVVGDALIRSNLTVAGDLTVTSGVAVIILPTSASGLPSGAIWNNAGTVTVVP